MTLQIRIHGIAEIETALADFEPTRMRKTLMKASAAGAKIVRRQMRANLAGRGRGLLAKSVRYKAMRRSTTKLVGHVIAPMGKAASARALVEYGHAIRRKKGGPELGRVKPHPFIQPAFDATEEAALAAMEKTLYEVMKEF